MVKKLTISDNESSSEEVKKEEVPTKPKKVLSEKQKEALIKGRQKRLEKIDEFASLSSERRGLLDSPSSCSA